MDKATISSYNHNARDFATRYNCADMAIIHGILWRHLPESGRILEIGCGSGRDAAFLVRKGFDVTGVDASSEMLAAAIRNHPELNGRLVCEGFPFPQNSPFLNRQFSGIVSIATFMHIPDQDLFECATQLRDLLPSGGVLIISVSIGREGIVDGRDAYGRLNIERPLEQLQLLFERLGFWFVAKYQNDDSFARSMKWHTLVMQRIDRNTFRSVDEVETIISRDRKDATYKLALLRALCDIAQTGSHTVKWHHNGIVSVPLGLVAEKWLLYYWPIIELDGPDGRAVIPQKRGLELRRPISFRKEMHELILFYRAHGGLSSMYHDYKHETIPRDGLPIVDSVINKIAQTIVAGPVRYAGGALERNQQYFGFEGHQTAKGKCNTPLSASEHLGRILVPAGAWREFCLIGHWISESLVLRWAELTHEISNCTIAIKDVVDRLLVLPEIEREVQLARSIYSDVPDLRCVWTDAPVARNFAVDHTVPFSIWHSNDLWNLLPTAPGINTQKSDKLVSKRLLVSCKERIIGYWQLLKDRAESRFILEMSRSLLPTPYNPHNWKQLAFAGLLENIETLAFQRGLLRWEP